MSGPLFKRGADGHPFLTGVEAWLGKYYSCLLVRHDWDRQPLMEAASLAGFRHDCGSCLLGGSCHISVRVYSPFMGISPVIQNSVNVVPRPTLGKGCGEHRLNRGKCNPWWIKMMVKCTHKSVKSRKRVLLLTVCKIGIILAATARHWATSSTRGGVIYSRFSQHLKRYPKEYE
jgi:hypothetical protein